MKRQTIIKLYLGTIAILLASCVPDDAVFDKNVKDLEPKTYFLNLDADAPRFETGSEGETRASGSGWEDGDVIYISFSNGGSTIISTATYKSRQSAFEFASAPLNTISDAPCSVYYFRGGTVSKEGDTINLDKYTAIFCDKDAMYSCLNNIITLNATFKPYTWRLCFMGEKNKQVKLMSFSNIQYYTSLDLSTGNFTTESDSEILQVQSDGYTPYIYGIFSNSSSIVQIAVGDISYSRTLASTKLSLGESGFFDIPSSSYLYGWIQDSGTINGYEYVNLGLKSGTLWATCNIGASSPEEFGDFYSWGEIEEKDYYDWNTYIYCNGTYDTAYNLGRDIAGTQYDVACVKWGGTWRMPSILQFIELYNNCTWTWTTRNGIFGYIVEGPNSNTIFLPAADHQFLDNNHFDTNEDYTGGDYWSSSEDYQTSAHYLSFYSGSMSCYQSCSKDWGLSVRAVSTEGPKPEHSIAEPVDLGLPSGTKWASWNIGASSPEEYGGYYAWGETEPKGYYDQNTYLYYIPYLDNKDHYYYIGDDIANTEYDVAHVMWGDSWSMPTIEQFEELCDYCSWTWISRNGKNGYLVTGPNNNSIFLPAAGYYWGERLFGEGSSGYYWSSTLHRYMDYEYCAYELWFEEYLCIPQENYRYEGVSIRAVCQ